MNFIRLPLGLSHLIQDRSPEYWVAVVKPDRILYEMGGVTENIARRAISIAASKMPIRTQFIISG